MTQDCVDPQPLLFGKRRGFFAADEAKTNRDLVNHDGGEKDVIDIGTGEKGIRQILPRMQLERLLRSQTAHDG